ncbi:MAG: ABC transporter ATP-binding protein [Micromonosporaceae bacterium]
MAAVYEVESLTKTYPGAPTAANRDISLTIHSAEIFGLLGPNGAGKTTLVRQLAGLLAPSQGVIRLFGVDITRVPHMVPAHVAVQPQAATALLDLSVHESVHHTARIRGLSAVAARAATDEILSLLSLRPLADRRVRTLSGGERRLVSLAVTLVGDRPVLILDEPTNELAPEARRLVWDHLLALNAAGRTIVLVTHDVLEAERVIARVGLINHGRLMALGPTGELRSRVDQRMRLELTLADPAGLNADGLAALLGPAAEVLYRTGDRVLVLLPRPAVRPALAHLVDQVGPAGVTDLRVTGPTLEDVYLQLGGGQRLD